MSHSEMHEYRDCGGMTSLDFCHCYQSLTNMACLMTIDLLNIGHNRTIVGLLGDTGHNIEAFSDLVYYYLGEEAFEESY